MTETRKRNVHLPKFKAKVGLLAARGVKIINEIAQEFGVYPMQVDQWKRKIQSQARRCLRVSAALSLSQRTARPTGCMGRLGA